MPPSDARIPTASDDLPIRPSANSQVSKDEKAQRAFRDLERLRQRRKISSEQYERMRGAFEDFARKQTDAIEEMTDHTSPSPSGTALSNPSEGIMQAQQIIGVAMGWCLALWFAPVVSGLAVNKTEYSMVRDVLVAMGKQPSENVVDKLFWCCRKKLLALNLATYVPFAGTAFQLFEVYALGQFTIHCATKNLEQVEEKYLSDSWKTIETEIFSGSRVVSAYEEFTGNSFPADIEPKFVGIVDSMRDAYRAAEGIPGLMWSQEVAGEVMHQAVNGAKKLLSRLVKKAIAGVG